MEWTMTVDEFRNLSSDLQNQIKECAAESELARAKTRLMSKEQLMEKKRKEDSDYLKDEELFRTTFAAVVAREEMRLKAREDSIRLMSKEQLMEMKRKEDSDRDKAQEPFRKALAALIDREELNLKVKEAYAREQLRYAVVAGEEMNSKDSNYAKGKEEVRKAIYEFVAWRKMKLKASGAIELLSKI